MTTAALEYARRAGVVREFRSALEDYISAHDRAHDEVLGQTYWIPKPDRADEVPALRRKLNEVSGPAARATSGKFLVMSTTGQQVNPIANWSRAFEQAGPIHGFTVRVLSDFVDSAIGELDALSSATEADVAGSGGSAESHQSVVAKPRLRQRLQRFLVRVRKDSPLWVQVAVGTIGSLIAVGLLALAGRLLSIF